MTEKEITKLNHKQKNTSEKDDFINLGLEKPHAESTDLNDISEKIEPILEEAMHKYFGVTINELKDDLTDKLKKPWSKADVDISIPFKKAKLRFKKEYLRKLLLLHFGNVSEVARISGINRRSIHRIIVEAGIDVEKIRVEMVKQYDIKQQTVNHIIEDVLDNYKSVLHPEKLESMYKNVSEVTKELIEELPEKPVTLDQAESEFEKNYVLAALKDNEFNITSTAKKIGLRYETLHRKIRDLGLDLKKMKEDLLLS